MTHCQAWDRCSIENKFSMIAPVNSIGRRSVAADRSKLNAHPYFWAFSAHLLTEASWSKVPSFGNSLNTEKSAKWRGLRMDWVTESTRAKTLIFPAGSSFIANWPNGVTIDFLKFKYSGLSRHVSIIEAASRILDIKAMVFHFEEMVWRYPNNVGNTTLPSSCVLNKYTSDNHPKAELTLEGDAFPLAWKVVGARLHERANVLRFLGNG